MMIRPPAARPCGSCPYRRDAPSGVWSDEEYDKLPAWDGPTGEQPVGVFHCHQQDGRVCAGWAHVHANDDTLGLRLALNAGLITRRISDAIISYRSPVALWPSGAAAAEHGKRDISDPSPAARRMIEKVALRVRGCRGAANLGSVDPIDDGMVERAFTALYAHAREEWGWGSVDSSNVEKAVRVVLTAAFAPQSQKHVSEAAEENA